jgi:anti-sigma B factor antagonist
MEHEVRKEGNFTIIALKGEVDMQHSPQARKLILGSLEQGLPLLVELSGVSYMDSSGVASLVEGLQLAKKRKLDFALAGVSQPVLNVLRLARLDRVFTIYATVEAGLA